MFFHSTPEYKARMPSAEQALPGRSEPMETSSVHTVLGTPIKPPFPEGMQQLIIGMGCFWGAERLFWRVPGVYSTAVGYIAGMTPNPTYDEVCSGQTGHNEVVRVIFDPTILDYDGLLKVFWEGHDPTQGMQQGNDRGTQYRSGIYTYSLQQEQAAKVSCEVFTPELQSSGFGVITTEILPVPTFYYAEDYHQQYLAKNPRGYCGIGGTGVSCPIGLIRS